MAKYKPTINYPCPRCGGQLAAVQVRTSMTVLCDAGRSCGYRIDITNGAAYKEREIVQQVITRGNR